MGGGIGVCVWGGVGWWRSLRRRRRGSWIACRPLKITPMYVSLCALVDAAAAVAVFVRASVAVVSLDGLRYG